AIPAALAGGETYANAILWGQSAGRMVESFAHAQPVWWYISMLPLLLAPWLFWTSAWRAISRLPIRQDVGVRFILCWLLPVFVIFSLISGKQVHYLLPLLPGVALLLARALHAAPERTSALAVVPMTALYGLLAAAVFFAPMLHDTFG